MHRRLSIKGAMVDNATDGVDYDLQFHLEVDTLPTGIGDVLFQLPGVPEESGSHPEVPRM